MSQEKYDRLLAGLRRADSAVLAFSGGVDSSFLLRCMLEAGMRFLAVTAVSETMPAADQASARSLAAALNAPHQEIATDELSNGSFAANPPDRCFHCKDELFRRLDGIRREAGFAHIFDGSNADDLLDHRPGLKAAALHGVKSPLAEAGMTKNDIRALSALLGLPAWDRPASPCLSSRIPYGQRITRDALKRIESAEAVLRSLGIPELRVRIQGETARIEVPPAQMPLLIRDDVRLRIAADFRRLGFRFISLDLEGFESGRLNRLISEP